MRPPKKLCLLVSGILLCDKAELKFEKKIIINIFCLMVIVVR